MDDMIEFDPPKVAALRKAYETALAEGRDQFTFEDRDVPVSYARDLLEFLEGRTNSPPEPFPAKRKTDGPPRRYH